MKPANDIRPLFSSIKQLIEQSKRNIAVSVNAELARLYWNVGNAIQKEILGNQRAEYGKQVVAKLAKQLQAEYGKGWSEQQLRHCLHSVETFPDKQIMYTLCTQLTWSHLRILIFMDDLLKRDFYIEMCKLEKWSVRTFRERVNSMLYERTAISRKPDETIKQQLQELNEEGKITPELVFRDPYFLDFLGLKNTWSEKDLEAAIVAELQHFISEMGNDFAFMARQKRISIDNRDYKIDLLFYHRRLKALIAIDLKMGEFEAAHKGQMELYLAWLQKHESVEGENPPLGLILCAGKNHEHVELLQLHQSNIKIAEYLTLLPPKQLLLDKLHQAIAIAQEQLENRNADKTKGEEKAANL